MMHVYQTNPRSFSQDQKPCFQSFPPEPWSYHDSHGYPYLRHFCCNHNNFQGYSSLPHPYPNFPPYYPMHCCGDRFPYSKISDFYPPPHPMDYDADKNTGKSRSYPSFGSVNEDSNDERRNNFMIPKHYMSYPYPFMWIPPEFARNKEVNSPWEPEVEKKDNVFSDPKSRDSFHYRKSRDEGLPLCVPPEFVRNKEVKSVEKKESSDPKSKESFHYSDQQPQIRDGWFPIDMKILSSLLESEKKGDRHEEIKKYSEEMENRVAAESFTSKETFKKTVLSDEKAAELIQSIYRGYAIRKWDSLKKLKQLSEVKEHVVDVKNRVKALQCKLPGDDKEKIFIGELIMGLLLKLDTIQGLLPFVREVRKSLARELVKLQGMVDDMTIVPSLKPTEEKEQSSEEVMEVPMVVNVLGRDETAAMVVLDACEAVVLKKSPCEEAMGDPITVATEDCAIDSWPLTEANVSLDMHNSGPDESVTMEVSSSNESKAVDDSIEVEKDKELKASAIDLGAGATIADDMDKLMSTVEPHSSFDEVINEMAEVIQSGNLKSTENREIVGTANQSEVSDCDLSSDLIITNDEILRLQNPQVGVAEGGRTLALDDESSSKQLLLTDNEGDNETAIKEDEQLRKTMEKLIEVGKEQLILISNLSCRVKDMEKELKRKKKQRTPRPKLSLSRSSSIL